MVMRVPPRRLKFAFRRTSGSLDRLRSFRNNEDGAITVEFVLWVPVFMLILMLIVDASVLFVAQSNFWGVARDSARRVAINSMTTVQADTWATAEARFGTIAPDVEVATDAGNVSVTISTPFSNIDVFGIMGLTGLDLVAKVTQRIETP